MHAKSPKWRSGLFKLGVGLCLLASGSWAQGEVTFNDSRLWKRPKLVEAGQQVWAFQTSYQKISDRFSGSGRVEPLGNKYSRAITWGQLLSSEQSLVGRADMENYMRAKGAKSEDIAATSTYGLDREDLGFSVEWAYGLTKNWMIGFQVPLILRRTTVSSRIEMTPFLAQGAGQAGQRSMLGLNQGQVSEKVKDLAESELSNSGYDNVPDQQQSWEWGDVALMSQFYLANQYHWHWALQQTVRFPTAQNPSVADYLSQASDDGNVDLGVTSLVDYRTRRWALGGRLGYVAQLPDSARLRVETDSNGVDPNISRDLGDWVWGSLDADFHLNRRLGFELEYAFLAKGEDKYSTSDLGRDTEQEIHQTRLGVLYELGATTTRRGVDRKWVATAGYTQPWSGRNSVDAGRAALELISYF